MTATGHEPSLEARFAGEMGTILGPDFPKSIALAVSGGGDSMAMLALAHGWSRTMGVSLHVVTVDHGLRSEAASEAQMVAAECAALGHPHACLRWHWDGRGNVQDAGRQARFALIDQWRGSIRHVLFAHTSDDLAETFLMRLARGSGVEGLSAMAPTREVIPVRSADLTATDIMQNGRGPDPARADQEAGFTIVRPLLNISRAELRHYAETLKVPFVDDPSNEDERFHRIRVRKAFADIGIDADTLSQTARRMSRAREALSARASDVAGRLLVEDRGDTGHLVFDRDGFSKIERDTQLRLLAAALMWVGHASYRPRAASLDGLLDRVLSGGGGPLIGGCVRPEGPQFRVFREFAAVADLETQLSTDRCWDQVWQAGHVPNGATHIRALGQDGWSQVPEKAKDTPPFEAALSLPAIFQGDVLLACPGLRFGAPGAIAGRRSAASFVTFVQLR